MDLPVMRIAVALALVGCTGAAPRYRVEGAPADAAPLEAMVADGARRVTSFFGAPVAQPFVVRVYAVARGAGHAHARSVEAAGPQVAVLDGRRGYGRRAHAARAVSLARRGVRARPRRSRGHRSARDARARARLPRPAQPAAGE